MALGRITSKMHIKDINQKEKRVNNISKLIKEYKPT